MSESVQRESPLSRFIAAETSVSRPAGPGVHLSERRFLGHLNLRGDPADQSFRDAIRGMLGADPPLEPNTVAEGPELAVLWLGADEWLVLTPPGREAAVVQALRDALGEQHFALTDVSGGQTVINLRGDRARDVLAKGCTLDLHPRVFGPGRCAQSHVAKANVIIRQLDGTPSYDLIVRRGFAEYLALWLKDAAREHGLSVGAQADS